MALLTEWSDDNRVITDGLIVSYESELVFGTWTQMSLVGGAVVKVYDKAWRMTRKATKSYKYTGMDYATAQKCAESMVSKYTRPFRQSRWDALEGDFINGNGGSRCMAQVAVRYAQGNMYEVTVDVREVDALTSINEAGKSIFGDEDKRDYDGEKL